MSEPKRHHYVPKFYLDGFTDPDKQGQIWVRSATDRSNIWRRRGPRAVAFEQGYYSIKGSKGGENSLEKLFSQTEKVHAEALKKLINGSPLDEKGRLLFALFVAEMIVRVPVARTAAKQSADDVIRLRAAAMREYFLTHPAQFDEWIKDRECETGKRYTKEQVLEYLDPDIYHLTLQPQAYMKLALHLLPMYADVLLRMGWTFGYSGVTKEPNYFITSDCPVTVIDPKSLFDRNHGLGNPDLEITMALSRSVGFHASHRTTDDFYGEIDSSRIGVINERTALTGKRFLLAPKPNFVGWGRVEEVWKGTRLKSIIPPP